jgi:hypothetical protein
MFMIWSRKKKSGRKNDTIQLRMEAAPSIDANTNTRFQPVSQSATHTADSIALLKISIAIKSSRS